MAKKENGKSFSITHTDIAVLNAIIKIYSEYGKLPTSVDIRSILSLASPTISYSIQKLIKIGIVVPVPIQINKKKSPINHYKPILDIVYVIEPNLYLLVTQNGATMFTVSIPNIPEYQKFREPGNIFSISELPNELKQFFSTYPLTVDYQYATKKNDYAILYDTLLSKYFKSTRKKILNYIKNSS